MEVEEVTDVRLVDRGVGLVRGRIRGPGRETIVEIGAVSITAERKEAAEAAEEAAFAGTSAATGIFTWACPLRFLASL